MRGLKQRRQWAHPRSRGEHARYCEYSHSQGGSSPLARGTPFGVLTNEQAGGLIPARAGNTYVRLCRLPFDRAHPRSRGEH